MSSDEKPDPVKALLLMLAKAIQKDPNLCARIVEALPWDHPIQNKWGSASEKGWEFLSDLMDEVEK